MISPVRFSVKRQAPLGRSKRMGQHRGLLTPEERARIMELQDLLIDRFVIREPAHRESHTRRDLHPLVVIRLT